LEASPLGGARLLLPGRRGGRTGRRSSGSPSLGQTGGVAEDEHTLERIKQLVSEEKQLRGKLLHGEVDPSEEHRRLHAIETELDQCWDLLRQRRALRETGGDPSQAHVRPRDEVEGYLN